MATFVTLIVLAIIGSVLWKVIKETFWKDNGGGGPEPPKFDDGGW